MVGWLFASVFGAVLLAYICTEFLLTRFDLRSRVVDGRSGLLLLLSVNLVSFALLFLSSSVLMAASGLHFYLQAGVIAICAQTLWATQHVWSYYQDHVRMGREGEIGPN